MKIVFVDFPVAVFLFLFFALFFLRLCCVFTSLSVFRRINVFINQSVLGLRSLLVKWLTHLLRHPKLLGARLDVYLMKTVKVLVLWRCIPKSV